jgi:hypothetical protein
MPVHASSKSARWSSLASLEFDWAGDLVVIGQPSECTYRGALRSVGGAGTANPPRARAAAAAGCAADRLATRRPAPAD